MAKKKRFIKNDSRGYATSTVPTVAKKNETKLSDKQQQEHLQTLLLHDTDAPAAAISTTWVDTTTREFYKRMDSLYSALVGIGFKEPQVEQIVIGLASFESTAGSPHILALENALDWACLRLPTEDLPPILTEAHLRDVIKKADSTVEVLQVASTNQGTTRTFESTAPIVKAIVKEEMPKEMLDHSKAWILSRYQYEFDEDGSEDATISLPINEDDASLLPEQVLLAKLDQEVQALKADVNDEAANYMRGKHEIKDMKKSLQKLEGERNKLKAKVSKLLAASKSMDDEVVVNDTTGKSLDELQDDNANIFGMFEEPAMEAERSNPKPTIFPEDPSQVNELTDPFQLTRREPSIAKDWTGKTPKTLLEDHCRKHKMPRPNFAKILGTRHGCRVTITCKPAPLVLEHTGPFFDWKDAQEYVSTHAMYKMTPDLPLYRVLPPLFSDLWKKWLQLLEDAKKLQKDASALESEERILQLIALIPARLSLSNSKQISKPASAANEAHATGALDTREDGGESNDRHGGAGGKASHVPTGLGRKLQIEFTVRQSKTEYLEMKQIRGSLPMHAYKEQILKTIAENTVTVLHAETGAGKTTQCPQFVLEQALLDGTGDSVSILCTQPRRISALSVAERVAEEMCERLGDLVGYQIRMESKRTSKTRLLFCTTGVVLRRLQDDPNLTGVTHVVVDEVHERQCKCSL
jgi:ATP-dependent RNA helicase DHX29